MTNIGLIGTKIGMSREFFPIGISVPVTVIKIEKGRVIDLITKDKRGYDAIKVGFGKIKTSKLTKSMKGFYSKKSTEPKKYLKEYRVENISNFKEGNEIGLEIFKDVKFVDVTSKSIGKGFAGVMKRYNFSGLGASHGVSVSHRSGGSTGQRQDPGKVFKGRKMAGHMGDKFRTILNLEIDGKEEKVIPRDISFDPLSDEPIHIDFLRIIEGAKLALEIPVKFVNSEKSPGLKKGGVLNIVRRKIELKCPAENIPLNFW